MGAESESVREGLAPSSIPVRRVALVTPETVNMPEEAYEMGQAPTVSVTGKNYDEAFEKAIKWWSETHPNEVTQFEQHMERTRARRGEESTVFTREQRAYRHHADIPAKLYYAIGFALGCSQWILDEKVRNAFFERFRAGLTTKKVEAKRD